MYVYIYRYMIPNSGHRRRSLTSAHKSLVPVHVGEDKAQVPAADENL